MNIQKIMKNKAPGFKLILVSMVITAIALIMYTFFGVTSETTVPSIIVCLAATLVLGAVLFFYEGFVSDYAVIAMTALVGVAFAQLLGDSIGDVTEFITGVGMYGNPDNVYMRAAMAVIMLVDAIMLMIASKNDRVKEST